MVSPIRDLDLSLTNERRNIINKSGGTDPKLPVADIAPLKNESSASTEPVSHKLAESNSNKCSTFMPRVIINTVESSSQSQDLRQRLSKTQVVTRNVGEGVASQQSGYSTQHSETSAADAYSIEKNRFYPALKLFNHPCLKFLQELPVCQQNRCRYNHELPACDVILGKMLKFTNEVICNIYDGFIKKTRLTFTRYFLVMCQIYVNRRIVPSLERLVSDCEHYKSYNFLETIFNAMSACGINASDSLMLILKNCDICSASESIIKIVRDNPPVFQNVFVQYPQLLNQLLVEVNKSCNLSEIKYCLHLLEFVHQNAPTSLVLEINASHLHLFANIVLTTNEEALRLRIFDVLRKLSAK